MRAPILFIFTCLTELTAQNSPTFSDSLRLCATPTEFEKELRLSHPELAEGLASPMISSLFAWSEVLGGGKFGEVRAMGSGSSSIAIKRIPLVSETIRELSMKEIRILKMICGMTNFISLREPFVCEEEFTAAFLGCVEAEEETESSFYLFMTRLSGDFSQKEVQIVYGNLPADKKVILFLNVIDIFERLSRKGIVHHDIRLENLMQFGVNFEDPRLVDFGMAKFLTQSSQASNKEAEKVRKENKNQLPEAKSKGNLKAGARKSDSPLPEFAFSDDVYAIAFRLAELEALQSPRTRRALQNLDPNCLFDLESDPCHEKIALKIPLIFGPSNPLHFLFHPFRKALSPEKSHRFASALEFSHAILDALFSDQKASFHTGKLLLEASDSKLWRPYALQKLNQLSEKLQIEDL